MHYLKAARIFDGDAFHYHSALAINGDHIVGLVATEDIPADAAVISCPGTLAPGFIDVQVNGGGGVLFNNAPNADTVTQMAVGHRSAGTTAIMPTIISDTAAVHRAAAQAVAEARAAGCASILGIHIEGPFFDMAKRGTHNPDMIRALDDEDIAWLSSLTAIKAMLTLAPEHATADQIRVLSDAGILVCAGHTDAAYEQVNDALEAGLRGFTHLYNAMSPLTSRSPGTVGAALDSAHSWVGIIADGHHVHPTSIRIAQRCLPRGKLMLVSDSMSNVGSDETSFTLYGEKIEVHEGKLVNAEGALAGSAIGLNDAVRYSRDSVGIAEEECLRMASRYPAEFLDLGDQLGSLHSGYRADIVHFDAELKVYDTWVAGNHLSHIHGPNS
ncbi:N-acetylglucosamine-6-phosphate deacetylase [Halioglobus sp. HI00S01]|uniref:N-acetylglucosamine-6-phosphate deacetylase n=1 Tax=Halioglobus sp. HI00S01 TaxID=1822214 RepID=UPI0007C2CD27|nr:N-acetylglucosamine-6-phosphate deacetylase [Halioglobus sp. HI00S01]KZX54964.1 N-acetylglucosamine-6-phosphate deacetylase [Halioglobus sp. HI00S01]